MNKLVSALLAAVGLLSLSTVTQSAEIQMVSWMDKKSPAEATFEKYLKQQFPDLKFSYVYGHRNKGKLAQALRKSDYSNIDLVVSGGTTATKIVKTYLKGSKPLLFHTVSTPVLSGIADSMQKAGDNITGVSFLVDLKTQFDVLSKIKNVKKLGVVFDPREKQSPVIKKKLADMGKQAGIEVTGIRVIPDAGNFDTLLKNAAEQAANLDAVYIIASTSYTNNIQKITSALPKDLLVMGYGKAFADNGASIAIDTNPAFTLKATLQAAATILKGKSPGEMPVVKIPRNEVLVHINKNRAANLNLKNLDSLGFKVNYLK